LDEYLSRKSEIRRAIAADISPSLASVGKVQLEQVKKGIIALAYGARLSTSDRVSLAETIPDKRAREAFVAHPFVRALKDDLRRASRDIVDHHASANGWVENAFGVRQEFDLRSKLESAVSHIITGYEALALDAVLQRWGEAVLLAMHDGWIMQDRIPTEEFEDEIFRKVGFRLSVEVSRLQGQPDCDEDCAPNPEVENNAINQDFTDFWGGPVIINSARRCTGGGDLPSSSSSSVACCPCFAVDPSWNCSQWVGKAILVHRPRWNLPPRYRGLGVRVGRRRRRVEATS
jgi:hypothetical protein